MQQEPEVHGSGAAAAAAAPPQPEPQALPTPAVAEQTAPAATAALPPPVAATLPLPATLPAAALRPQLQQHLDQLAAHQALMRVGELAMQRHTAKQPQAQPQQSPQRRQARTPRAAAQPAPAGTDSFGLSAGCLGSLLRLPVSSAGAGAAPSEVTLLDPSAVVGAEGQRRLQQLTVALGGGGYRPAVMAAAADEQQPGTAHSVSPQGGGLLAGGRLGALLATPRAAGQIAGGAPWGSPLPSMAGGVPDVLGGLPAAGGMPATPLARGPASELDRLYGRLQSQDLSPFQEPALGAGLPLSPAARTPTAAGVEAAQEQGVPALMLVQTPQGLLLLPCSPLGAAQLLPVTAAAQQQAVSHQAQQAQQAQQAPQAQQQQALAPHAAGTPSGERAPRSGSQASSNGSGRPRESSARKRPRKPAKASASPEAPGRKPSKAARREAPALRPAKAPRREAAAAGRAPAPASEPMAAAPTPSSSGVMATGEGLLSSLHLTVRGSAAEADAPAYVTFHLPAAGAGGEQGGAPQVLPVRCRFLFQKQLSASDAGGMPRIVLPRLAGKYVRCSSQEGEEVQLLDSLGRMWTWLLKFWEERERSSGLDRPSPSPAASSGGPSSAEGAPAAAGAARGTPPPAGAAPQRTYIFEGVRPFQQAWRLAAKRVLAFYQMPGGGLLVDPHALEQHFGQPA